MTGRDEPLPPCVPDGKCSNPERVRELITDLHAGDALIVHFIKRSTGRPRRMECRYRSDTNEQNFSFDAADKNLLPVFDFERQGARMIPSDDVLVILAPEHDLLYEGPDLWCEAGSRKAEAEDAPSPPGGAEPAAADEAARDLSERKVPTRVGGGSGKGFSQAPAPGDDDRGAPERSIEEEMEYLF